MQRRPSRNAHPRFPLGSVRFGPFLFDPRSGDLVGDGVTCRLSDQPLVLLTALLEHPGRLVTREELRQRLWPDGTYVDFDHGLNSAVRRLREALKDSATTPRFVETVPRRGYRPPGPVDAGSTTSLPRRRKPRVLKLSTLPPVATTPMSHARGAYQDGHGGRWPWSPCLPRSRGSLCVFARARGPSHCRSAFLR